MLKVLLDQERRHARRISLLMTDLALDRVPYLDIYVPASLIFSLERASGGARGWTYLLACHEDPDELIVGALVYTPAIERLQLLPLHLWAIYKLY